MAGLAIVTACAISGIPARYLARSLIPFRWLILLTFFLNVLFTGGRILVAGPLPFGGITAEGLVSGTIYSLRLLLLVMGASLLTLTTQPVMLVAAVEKLLAPFKWLGFNTQDFALSMMITIRFIPVLIDEAVKIRKSYVARGFNPDRNFAARMQGMSMLMLPLLNSTFRRAEELALAMECRLYRGDAARTRFFELSMAGRDWLALIVVLVVSGMMVFL
jgi:energy-coupling factor transport system permease protein